jgi:hypothetical protein
MRLARTSRAKASEPAMTVLTGLRQAQQQDAAIWQAHVILAGAE